MDDLISRQAAIDALKNDMASLDHIIKGMSANDVRLDAYVSQRNQINYDIYTINNLPPVQPEQLGTDLAEVGTDCISRQAAIDAVNCVMVMKGIRSGKSIVAEAVESAKGIMTDNIRQLPPAQPERIRGRWTRDNACSECGCQPWFSGDIHNYNFCPHCGADMREVTECLD